MYSMILSISFVSLLVDGQEERRKAGGREGGEIHIQMLTVTTPNTQQ